MKQNSIFLLCLIFLAGCGSSHFLQDDLVKQMNAGRDGDNRTLYYKVNYTIDESGGILKSTHCLIKLADNLESRMKSMRFVLSSTDDLLYFQARMINIDGSSYTYGKNDLYRHNPSSGFERSEAHVYLLSLQKQYVNGDLFEYVYSEKIGFSNLGMSFTLDEAGNKVDNIYCDISLPDKFRLDYILLNDTASVSRNQTENSTTYSFHWKNYKSRHNDNPLQKLNYEPGIAACFSEMNTPGTEESTWKNFGNWYLELIKDKIVETPEIKSLAAKLTEGKSDPKEKLDAIFNYCQKNIRYEMVSVKGGEIIPNECRLVLERKFGDCKDYSAIIYAMARSAGINVNMALCYRGRGLEFHDLPVSQFNHVIIHYSYNGRDYWYDGTNRISEPGLTTFDLANQPALIIEKDNSRIVRIQEDENNLLTVKGTLIESKNGFRANLRLIFTRQYAIPFFYYDIFLKRDDMADFLTDWIKENLSEAISFSSLTWENSNNGSFVVSLLAEIPNCLTTISNVRYTSFHKMFPEVLFNGPLLAAENIFYFPQYNRISFDLSFQGLCNAESPGDQSDATVKYEYSLPIGPFMNNAEKKEFAEKYNLAYSAINNKIKLFKRTSK